ncbi:MAG: class I SAM-dependent methyltransferase [Candidatus Micrarchaeota archaeon]|nr:class I SAM-dependent methyltransferase [Candidatus Micrarchaeota archaeon]
MQNYISDSRGIWSCGDPIPALSRGLGTGSVFQLLIHPVWWGEKSLSPQERLEEFFQSETKGRDKDYKDAVDASLMRIVTDIRRSGYAGQFDTDASALTERINAHEKYGTRDLNEWIFENLGIKNSLSVLDLGCGNGKQSLPLAQLLGPGGRVVAIDKSSDSLVFLKEKAKALGVNGRIDALCMDMDDYAADLHGRIFDRVLSSYSIYYSKNLENVFKTLSAVLKPGGILFFCGPSKSNNSELIGFQHRLKRGDAPKYDFASEFMEDLGQKLARRFFKEVEVSRFENPLVFTSPKGLLDYWTSYNLYDKTIEGKFKTMVAEHFRKNKEFVTVKRVIGVKASGPRITASNLG